MLWGGALSPSGLRVRVPGPQTKLDMRSQGMRGSCGFPCASQASASARGWSTAGHPERPGAGAALLQALPRWPGQGPGQELLPCLSPELLSLPPPLPPNLPSSSPAPPPAWWPLTGQLLPTPTGSTRPGVPTASPPSQGRPTCPVVLSLFGEEDPLENTSNPFLGKGQVLLGENGGP